MARVTQTDAAPCALKHCPTAPPPPEPSHVGVDGSGRTVVPALVAHGCGANPASVCAASSGEGTPGATALGTASRRLWSQLSAVPPRSSHTASQLQCAAPSAHPSSEHDVAPRRAYRPTAHGVHVPAPSPPVALEYVFTGHGTQCGLATVLGGGAVVGSELGAMLGAVGVFVGPSVGAFVGAFVGASALQHSVKPSYPSLSSELHVKDSPAARGTYLYDAAYAQRR